MRLAALWARSERMADGTIDERVTILEQRVAILETLPARVEGVELQIVQLRVDVRAGFSALHAALVETGGEMRALKEEMRSEMRALNEETRSQMRALHEDTRADVRLLAEHLARVLARLDDRRQ
jgi:hypothetical protein